jgi:TetR/AcrR family transcriptional regulator, regulator of autoinduction and epiphytic fitness
MAKAVKRKYSSAKRQEQARATRAAIIDAGSRLFTKNGYVATTIQAIADEAGVAIQTVYAVFGNKREVLHQVLESAVVGDRDPQQTVRAFGEEPDPRRRAAMAAALVTQISKRLAPIVRVVNEAAAVDAEFAATQQAITAQRRADMVTSAKLLAGEDGLQLGLEDAVGTLYMLYNPELFTHLTERLGWSERRFEKWLATMLYRTLLG